MNCTCQKARYLTKKAWLRFFLALVDNTLGFFFHKSGGKIPEKVNKILVIKPDHLGDMLLLTSVFPLIQKRFPDAAIDIVCGKWALQVLENNPYIQKRHIINHSFANRSKSARLKKWLEYMRTYFSALKAIRKENYDLGLFMRSRRGNLLSLALLGGIKYTIGHGTAGFGPFLNLMTGWERGRHETEHFLEVLRPLGIDADIKNLRYEICPSKEDFSFVNDFWKKNIKRSAGTAVVHPGAGLRIKSLSNEKWKEVVNILEKKGFQIIITGSGDEKELAREISSGKSLNAAGLFNIPQLALLYKKASLIVTVDSLSSHLAGWSGTKTIVFYCGMGDKKQWGPLGGNINVLSLDKPCSPCETGCGSMACMDFDTGILRELI